MRLLDRLLAKWVRSEVRPDSAFAAIGTRQAAPVCYVLERRSAADVAVLANECVRHNVPSPHGRLLGRGRTTVAASLPLLHTRGWFDPRIERRAPPEMLRLIEAVQSDSTFDVRLVPAGSLAAAGAGGFALAGAGCATGFALAGAGAAGF